MKRLKIVAAFLLTALLLMTSSAAAFAEENTQSRYEQQQPIAAFCPEKTEPFEETAEVDSDWESQSDRIVSVKTCRVFDGKLNLNDYLSAAEIKDFEDVPFVSVREYLRLLFKDKVSFCMDKENGRFLINHNGIVVEIGLDTREVSCDGWDWFFGLECFDGMPIGVIESEEELISMGLSPYQEFTMSEPDTLSWSLNYEGLDIVVLDNDVLVPFNALQNIFNAGSSVVNQLLYNGDDFYSNTAGSDNDIMQKGLSPYEKAIYSGRFSFMEEPTDAYAKYNYACLCMFVDHVYGHKGERGIESLDSYLTNLGLNDIMSSPSVSSYLPRLMSLVNKVFDSGHDGLTLTSSVFGYALANPDEFGIVSEQEEAAGQETAEIPAESEEEEAVSSETADEQPLSKEDMLREYLGADALKMVLEMRHIESLRPEEYSKESFVAFEGDTAFIFFTSFKTDMQRDNSFYTELPVWDEADKSNFALFYLAMEDIKAHPEVKNVVVDLTCNGGGHGSALLTILGFLSPDGEVPFTYLDMRDDSYHSEY
ncbi:MAG: hypothetical protein HUJ76_09380 [Parasporobacterium sp.]|nr:hypothetical protein [Parasporobacterium sp.]